MTFAPTSKPVASGQTVQTVQTVELFSRSQVAHKMVVQPGQAIQIVVDGQVYTGQKQIKGQTLSLKRKGHALLLVAKDQEEPLLEVSGFYAPSPAGEETSHSADSNPAFEVDTQVLLQEGTRTQLASADLGSAARLANTPAWGTLVAQANMATATTPATSTTATTSTTAATPTPDATSTTSSASSGFGWVFGGLALAAAASGGGSKQAVAPAPADTTAPTLTITDNTSGTATGPVTFKFKFSETVTGFDASQVSVNNGTKGVFTAISANEYTLVVTPTASAKGDITVGVANTAVKDAAGNALAAVASYTQAFDTTPPDTTAPTAVVTDNAAGTATGPVTYTIAFSEPVQGFDVSKLSLTGGTLSGFAADADGKTFTVLATPELNTAGTLKLSVNPSGVTDTAGNAMATTPNVADQAYAQNLLQGTIVAGPVVSSNSLSVKVFNPAGQAIGSSSVSNTGTYKVALGNYTGPVALLVIDSDDSKPDYVDEVSKKPVDLSGNLLAAGNVGNSTTVQTLNINPITTVAALKAGFKASTDGTEVVPNTDATLSTKIDANNTAVAKALGLGSAADLLTATIVPTVNTDGTTNANANDYGKMLAVVAGMDAANGGDASKTISSLVSGITDSGTLTPTVQTDVKQGAAQAKVPVTELPPTVTGGGSGSGSGSTDGDTNAFGLTISDSVPGTANGNVTFTFTFNEAATGFDTTKITVTGGIKGTFTQVSTYVYTLVVTPASNSTTPITVSTSPSGVTSLVGSKTIASVPDYTQVVDTSAPAAPTINAIATDDIINANEQTTAITGTNETGATVALTIGANTRAATVTGTTWSYTLVAADITAMGQGAETISVTQTDAAGNTSPAATRPITVDTAAPAAPTIKAGGQGSLRGSLRQTGTQRYGFLMDEAPDAGRGHWLHTRLEWAGAYGRVAAKVDNLWSRLDFSNIHFANTHYQLQLANGQLQLDKIPSVSGTFGMHSTHQALPRVWQWSAQSHLGSRWEVGQRGVAQVGRAFMAYEHPVMCGKVRLETVELKNWSMRTDCAFLNRQLWLGLGLSTNARLDHLMASQIQIQWAW